MYKINVNVGADYDIIIDNNIDFDKYIKNVYKNNNVFLIVDSNVFNLYKKVIEEKFKNYNLITTIIEASEENKSLITYQEVVNKLIENNITRDSLIIGLGGGVVGDIASFIASTLLRGIKYISIPTTLLSQVDSSIGGKTGLNLNNKKNIIGTFYQPSLVLIDTLFLSTLSKEELNSGLGEVVKCGMIKDLQIISLLQDKMNLKEVIYKSLLVKKYYVEKDVYDLNERMILNFGHTFGHVIELENNLKHGIAVINGMILSIKYGIDLGVTNKNCLNTLYDVLNKLNINYENYDYKNYLNKLNYDKKNIEGYLNFIFIEEIEKPIIKKIERN